MGFARVPGREGLGDEAVFLILLFGGGLGLALFALGQCFAAANWGTLVAAGMDQSPVQYRASVQSFMPLCQALAALCAGVVSGMLSDAIGLTLALEVILVAGMLSAMLLLNAARASYDRDHQLQRRAGQYVLELAK